MASRTLGYRPIRKPVYEKARYTVASRPGCHRPRQTPFSVIAVRASAKVDEGTVDVPFAAPPIATCRRTLSTSRGLNNVSATAHPRDAESHSRCHCDTHGAAPRGGGGGMTRARSRVTIAFPKNPPRKGRPPTVRLQNIQRHRRASGAQPDARRRQRLSDFPRAQPPHAPATPPP